MMDWISTKRRYIAYFCLLFSAYTETCSRFGVTIAMMGGMIKHDCEDPEDEGEFCWSKRTQGLVLGSYFWGYTAQFLAILLAKRVLGFTLAYRLWLITSAVVQLCYPTLAAISPTLVAVSQTLRGFLACVMIAYNFDFIAKFSVGNESKVLIPLIGATFSVGQGTGSLLAGYMNQQLGWKYYFYFIGAAYLIGLILNLLFVHESLENYWYLTAEEKNMMTKFKIADKKVSADDCESHLALKTQRLCQEYKSLFCRLYLLAFCIYVPAYNLIYYNLFAVVPFYLYNVLGAEPMFISYLCISLAILIAVSTIAFSFLLRTLDEMLPWLPCRMIFTLVPMALQIVFMISLTACTTVFGGVFILTLSAIAASTLFSGSINTLNYEMDPGNSAVLISVYNSCGQVAGFLGPMLMVGITATDPGTPHHVYKAKWDTFFYVMAGFAGVAIVAIVAAYFLRPTEWVKKERMILEASSEVLEVSSEETWQDSMK